MRIPQASYHNKSLNETVRQVTRSTPQSNLHLCQNKSQWNEANKITLVKMSPDTTINKPAGKALRISYQFGDNYNTELMSKGIETIKL